MSRTSDRFYADAPHSGGWIFANAHQLGPTSSTGSLVLTRVAQGNYTLNRTAGAAETHRVVFNISNLRRLNEPQDLQEQFGGSASVPPGVAGRPPFTGATQLVPPTTWPAKGIRIDDVVVIYEVGVVDLTSAALVLDQVIYANTVAPAVTNIPLAATTLTLVVDADPYVITRAVTTPAFLETDLLDLIAEFEVVMANTGTIAIHGLGFHCSFNYD
ncbi:hypothetical protein LCGC14_2213610 [marine sediment metagenome]|uniref:Uncharacterized protein n=1 Tax=marine sediment metagenome TaxID=412755 RepID=A0A0F9DD69_9ZZZZ